MIIIIINTIYICFVEILIKFRGSSTSKNMKND